MNTILDRIFESKRRRVNDLKSSTRWSELLKQALDVRRSSTPYALRESLSDRESLNVIAEFKRASPSRGVINDSFEPAEVAREYSSAGAAAISVLTEEDHFNGSLDDLRAVRSAVTLPILRKDFVFDEFQIFEAAAAGADAVLLIAASLSKDDLSRLRTIAEDELTMDAIVEVHTADEMQIAVETGAKLIGVNNRNLKTFDVSLDASRDLSRLAPKGSTLIAESGLKTRDDLLELRALGFAGFLIGETLMRSDRPSAELRRLRGEGAN